MIFNTCPEGSSAEWELEANICLSEEKVGFKMDVLVGGINEWEGKGFFMNILRPFRGGMESYKNYSF